MKETDAYSHKDWIRAVNSSALLGWVIFTAPFLFGAGAGTMVDFFGVFVLAAVYGLPIAFFTSWIIAGPILARIMRHKVTWIGAALWGACISFLLAFVIIVIALLIWIEWSDSDGNFQVGVGNIQQVNGILEAFGWLPLLLTAIFVAIGIFIALVLRTLIGPGRNI